MGAVCEAVIRWKDTGDTMLALVAYPLDVREDDDSIFFYFNDRDMMLDAMREDTVHEFVIETLFDEE